jgi:hypothetical protein
LRPISEDQPSTNALGKRREKDSEEPPASATEEDASKKKKVKRIRVCIVRVMMLKLFHSIGKVCQTNASATSAVVPILQNGGR